MPRSIVWVCFFFACTPEAPPNVPPAPAPEARDAASEKLARGTTLFVDDKLVDCEGEHPMKCMRTRASKDAEWELFYAPIEGFTFEEGSAYELRVDMTDPKKPHLLEIVSKTKAPAR